MVWYKKSTSNIFSKHIMLSCVLIIFCWKKDLFRFFLLIMLTKSIELTFKFEDKHVWILQCNT